MSEPSPGDTDSAGQQPHEQPHGASEVVLVDDDEGAQDFQAVEQAAKRKMEELQKGLREGNFCADYSQWLKPVLERPAPQKPLQCMLKCIRGGEGVCGKLLSSKNPSKSAQDHFKVQGCKAMRQEAGQARLHQQKAKFWQAHMYQCVPPSLSSSSEAPLSACDQLLIRAQLVTVWQHLQQVQQPPNTGTRSEDCFCAEQHQQQGCGAR